MDLILGLGFGLRRNWVWVWLEGFLLWVGLDLGLVMEVVVWVEKNLMGSREREREREVEVETRRGDGGRKGGERENHSWKKKKEKPDSAESIWIRLDPTGSEFGPESALLNPELPAAKLVQDSNPLTDNQMVADVAFLNLKKKNSKINMKNGEVDPFREENV